MFVQHVLLFNNLIYIYIYPATTYIYTYKSSHLNDFNIFNSVVLKSDVSLTEKLFTQSCFYYTCHTCDSHMFHLYYMYRWQSVWGEGINIYIYILEK